MKCELEDFSSRGRGTAGGSVSLLSGEEDTETISMRALRVEGKVFNGAGYRGFPSPPWSKGAGSCCEILSSGVQEEGGWKKETKRGEEKRRREEIKGEEGEEAAKRTSEGWLSCTAGRRPGRDKVALSA